MGFGFKFEEYTGVLFAQDLIIYMLKPVIPVINFVTILHKQFEYK